MSHPSMKAKPSPCPHCSEPKITELVTALQVTNDALSAFQDDKTPTDNTQETGETRSYYLSPALVQHERELLLRYRASNFYDLLAEAHKLLIGVVKLMKSTHKDVRLRGYVLVSIGTLLEQVTALLTRMLNVYGKLERC